MYGILAGCDSSCDGVLQQLPGSAGEVHPHLHSQKFPQRHRKVNDSYYHQNQIYMVNVLVTDIKFI